MGILVTGGLRWAGRVSGRGVYEGRLLAVMRLVIELKNLLTTEKKGAI